MPSHDRDSGSATILAAVGVAILIVVLAVGLQLAGAVIARHRAESAADLAALAGAAKVLTGQQSACSAAASIAAANGAALQDCELIGLDLRVTVRVDAVVGPIGGAAIGRARAGPVVR
ncbi:MAG: flp pilus-assembly TadE/G-like family protein [Actinomycetota bacterium]|nr:flp pilus-assembly TadE/G-like family protein [Actinomycetota bacterium]